MRLIVKNILVTAMFLIFAHSFSYCETADIDELINEYNSATEVQRSQVEDVYRYKTVSVSGVIKDVEDWNAFDDRTDTSALYYKVTAEPKTTASKIAYNTLIFYKEKARVESLNKGEEIKISGSFIRIVDNIGSFSVWIYADELAPEDKVMFQL